jgi:hypothetical protein
MKSRHVTFLSTGVFCLGLAGSLVVAQRAPAPQPATAKPAPVSAHAPTAPQTTAAAGKIAVPAKVASTVAGQDHNAVIKRYCVTCHNEKRKAQVSGLALETFDVATAAEHAAVAEKMILKLQAGMMPPPGAARPDPATHAALITALETTVDLAAMAKPNPGRPRVRQRDS